MIEQTSLTIPQEIPGNSKLTRDQVPVVVADRLIARIGGDHLCQQRRTHILTVAPHLVHIIRFMPPATSRCRQCHWGDDIDLVGHLDAFHSIHKASVSDSGRLTVRIRRTVAKETTLRQFLEFEIQFHSVEVIEALTFLTRIGNIIRTAIMLHGIEPRLDIHLTTILVVVYCFQDCFCHQSRHVVQHLLGVIRFLYDGSLVIEHPESRGVEVGLEVIDTRVNHQFGIAYSLLEGASLTLLSRYIGRS